MDVIKTMFFNTNLLVIFQVALKSLLMAVSHQSASFCIFLETTFFFSFPVFSNRPCSHQLWHTNIQNLFIYISSSGQLSSQKMLLVHILNLSKMCIFQKIARTMFMPSFASVSHHCIRAHSKCPALLDIEEHMTLSQDAVFKSERPITKSEFRHLTRRRKRLTMNKYQHNPTWSLHKFRIPGSD